LIGRIWRHPQPKSVQVYRLIAANTADVFLNNNSFDKGAIMTAFAHSSEAISEFSSIHPTPSSVYICLGRLFV
jgi:hypothetical protein